jgi:predicted SpoU family rRNA methylase
MNSIDKKKMNRYVIVGTDKVHGDFLTRCDYSIPVEYTIDDTIVAYSGKGALKIFNKRYPDLMIVSIEEIS